MVKISQEHLIEQIRELKEIKPRKEWAVLLKSEILNLKLETSPNFQILNSKRVSKFARPPSTSSIGEVGRGFRASDFFFGFLTQKRLAYSFATLLFVIVGLIGFAQYTMPGDLLFPIRKISEQSEAALTGQTSLKQTATTLNNRINDLARAAKQGKKSNIPSAISEINENAMALAETLKDNPAKDPKTLKEIAVSLKVLADVPGTDLSANPDVQGLYQTIVESQIADLEKATLTQEQTDGLEKIKELYEEGRYVEALEEILIISN